MSGNASDQIHSRYSFFRQRAQVARKLSRVRCRKRLDGGIMAILNYTTTIAAEKTASEIQAKLVKANACAVLSEYENCVLSHLSFKVNTIHGEMGFRLPANIEGVLKAMQRDAKVPKNLKSREQAARVAWRIVKDWVEAQLAIIEADMATLPQVFLPYMQTGSGDTVYERFEKQGLLALTHQPEAA
jgi:hypothetical protein